MPNQTKHILYNWIAIVIVVCTAFAYLKSQWLDKPYTYVFAKEYPEITETVTQKPHELSLEEQIISEIEKTFGANAKVMTAIARCESGLNPKAVNENYTKDGKVWSRDWSIFQVNDKFHSSKGNIKDWKENIRIAKQIFKSQGFYGWSCYKSGSYKRFL